MARKYLIVEMVFLLVLISFAPAPAAALQAYPHWDGGFRTFPSSSYRVTGADSPNPRLFFEGNPRHYCEAGGGLHARARVTGPVTITYDFSGTVNGSAYAQLWSWKASAQPLLLLDEAVEGDYHYVGAVTLDVRAGELFEIFFYFGGCNYIQGTLDLNLDEEEPPLPEVMYTMWLLTRNDGSACLLKSESHPSVQVQKAFCFPDETDQSWVADNVACFGAVDENDFWSCAAEYGNWLGLNK